MTRDNRKLMKTFETTKATPLHQQMVFMSLRHNDTYLALDFVKQIDEGCECGAPFDETNRCSVRCWEDNTGGMRDAAVTQE